MNPNTIIPRERVAQVFAVSIRRLRLYEAHGLIHSVRDVDAEGYEPAEMRRIWSIVSLQRDLGVNLAGVEAILHMREQFDELTTRVHHLAEELRSLAEAESDDDRR